MNTPWLGFFLCVLLSGGGFILSIFAIIGDTKNLISYFVTLFSSLLIVFTIYVFLLPEAGIPPVIPLFFD